MRRLALTTATVGLLTIAGLGFAGTAPAAPSSAADVVAQLEADGHDVQLNGSSSYPLQDCKATGVHGLRGSHVDDDGKLIDTDRLSTVYVDVSCKTQ